MQEVTHENAEVEVPAEQLAEQTPAKDFGAVLRDETVAVSVKTTALGTSRKLTREQSELQADAFHANPRFVTGKKKLLNTSHEAFKNVSAVLATAKQFWRDKTVPYPDAGIRLLRITTGSVQDNIAQFEAAIEQFQQQLSDRVAALEEVYYSELIPDARESLGDLFDPADYPASLENIWTLAVEFPAVGPDERLMQLNPQLYERERQRAEQKFSEAVQLMEQALCEELAECVRNLVDRLTPAEVHLYRYMGDGEQQAFAEAESIHRRGGRVRIEYPERGRQPLKQDFETEDQAREWLAYHSCEYVRSYEENKSFRASSIENLQQFFGRFADLNINSNQELDRLVAEAKNAVAGVSVAHVRDCNVEQRRDILSPISSIADQLEDLMEQVRPRAISLDDV